MTLNDQQCIKNASGDSDTQQPTPVSHQYENVCKEYEGGDNKHNYDHVHVHMK